MMIGLKFGHQKLVWNLHLQTALLIISIHYILIIFLFTSRMRYLAIIQDLEKNWKPPINNLKKKCDCENIILGRD